MAKKAQRPRFVDTVRYGSELASIKAKNPKRFKKLQQIANRQGVTLQGLLSGAPPSLRERSTTAIRREAAATTSAAYKPLRAELNRREAANANLAAARRDAQIKMDQWIAGETDKLRADAKAADSALRLTQEKVHSELIGAQATTAAEMAKRLAEARLTSDPSQSTALAGAATAQAQGREHNAASREHSAALAKIGQDSNTAAFASLLATAPAHAARTEADNIKRAAEVVAARSDVLNKQAGDAAELRTTLTAANRQTAQANREFALAQGQLGVKKLDIMADLKKFAAEFKLEKQKFNFERWKAQNKDEVERLKIEMGYDKIAAENGRSAADRELKRRAQRLKERQARQGDGSGRKEAQQTYQIIESLASRATRAREELKQSDRVIKTNLLAKGYSGVQIDVALDISRNGGKISPRGIRKAKLIGIGNPLRFWERS